jgi:hypothetical protein
LVTEACERLLKERPLCNPYRLAYAWSQINTLASDELQSPERVDAVIARIDRAIGMGLEFGDAYAMRAAMNLIRCNFPEGEADVTRAIQLDSTLGEPHLRCMRGQFRYLLGNLHGAREDFEFAAAHCDPDEPPFLAGWCWMSVGWIGIYQGDPDAVHIMQEALNSRTFSQPENLEIARTLRRTLPILAIGWRFKSLRRTAVASSRFGDSFMRKLMIAGFRSGLLRPK